MQVVFFFLEVLLGWQIAFVLDLDKKQILDGIRKDNYVKFDHIESTLQI